MLILSTLLAWRMGKKVQERGLFEDGLAVVYR